MAGNLDEAIFYYQEAVSATEDGEGVSPGLLIGVMCSWECVIVEGMLGVC